MFKSVWDSHSALSEEADIYNLTFVRWNRLEEFSPWNCILLTLQEAVAHLKIDNIEQVYTYNNCLDMKKKSSNLFCSTNVELQ
jgi:IQ and ubiquitin-like domain-containing protein